MLPCLKDMIGVPGCDPKKDPRIYLNTLPGISIRSLDSVANEDKINFQGVLDVINERVALRIESDLISGIGINLKSYNGHFCTGRIKEPLNLLPASASPAMQGMIFEFKQSKHLVMRVLNLYFRSAAVQTLVFFVIDLVTNEILDNIVADLQIGENQIPVNKEYFPRRHSNRLFIGYPGNVTDYYETTDAPCYDNCTCDCNSIECRGGCTKITGFGIDYTKNTYGLSIDWAAECSYAKFICDNIGLFRIPILYAAGIEYIYETMGSSRLNKFTTTNKEQQEKLLTLFEKRYRESLTGTIKNLNLCDDCCFECIGGIKYKYVNRI